MNDKLNDTFSRLRQQRRKALIPFLTAGYPEPARFPAAIDAICESGADVLEIGFPHSDPLADGPVIQHASHTSIINGFTLSKGFAAVKLIARRHHLPIVLMCYTNLIHQAAYSTFVNACRESGVSGLIVPDMILEESFSLRSICLRHGLAFINMIAPTTPPARAAAIAGSADGFVYLVSVAGTTGARTRFNNEIKHTALRLRKATSLPICLGFGISSPEMAARAAGFTDGVIIGSKVIQLIDADGRNDRFPTLRGFLESVSAQLKGTR